MKHFIYKIVVSSILVFIMCIPVDLFLSEQLRKAHTYAFDEYSVWNDLYQGKLNADVAVYGSSRAWVHINSQMLEDSLGKRAYNLGIDGHNFWLQYLRHKLLLKYNSPPEVILLSLDMFTLQKKRELYNPDQFLPYMLWNEELKSYIDSYIGYDIYDYWFPLVRYYGKREAISSAVTSYFVPAHPDSGRKKGFMGKNLEWTDDFEKATRQMDFYEVKIDTPTFDLFNSFLAECKSSGIRLIFVYSPEYISGQKFVKNREEIFSLYKEIALKNDILFLDYSNDEMCQDKSYFYNASHLTNQGACMFTEKLIRDLKNLNLNRKIAESRVH
jgi:hypothetical protein